MSRSYKKHPYHTDGSPREIVKSKRFANKAVRNYKHKIANGNAYKHLFCSYNIHDYIIRYSWEEAKLEYENDPWGYLKDRYPTLKDFYKYWIKYYKMK